MKKQCQSVKRNSVQKPIFSMSQTSRTQSGRGEYNASLEVADTAWLVVGPQAPGVLPGMPGYAGTSTQTLLPNTMFDIRRPRLLAEVNTSSGRSRSVSPMGLTIAQRQAQLAAQMASTAISDVENAAATVDATRNVAEQALATASHATRLIEGILREHVKRLQKDTSRVVDDIVHRLAIEMTAATTGSAKQSKLRTCGMVDTLRDELCAKFAKDHAADEARRGQTETRLATLGSSIEGLQKRMNELNVPDVSLLVKLEQNLQQKIAESSSDAHVGIEQVSKRLEEQSKTNEDIVSVLNILA